MNFTPATAALLVRRNGGTDDEAIFLASMLPGENRGGDPTVVNTSASCGTENGRKLYATGLFQVCDYSSRGTREQLQDPDHNAREALQILRDEGEDAWTATPDPDAADEARRALTEGAPPMELWHPRAIDAQPSGSHGGAFIRVPWKLVLHTVEAPPSTPYRFDPDDYFGNGNRYWPHATIDATAIYQHLPINVSAEALYSDGSVATNKANAIQCEIMGQAAHIADLPDSTMRLIADWLGWCMAQTGCPATFAEFRGDGAYGVNAPQRFGNQEWLDANLICGHQHVPAGNDHWDPGAFPVDRLRALMGATIQEDPFMALTPAQQEDLLNTTKATNDEVGKMAPIVRDSVGGLPARLDQIEAKLDQLLAKP